jgi:hypothetical protein
MNVKLLAAVAVVVCAISACDVYRRSHVAQVIAVRSAPTYVYPVYKERLLTDTPDNMKPFNTLPIRDTSHNPAESAAHAMLRAGMLASGDERIRLLNQTIAIYPTSGAATLARDELAK